jgi:soluble lytic murein transglycosylase
MGFDRRGPLGLAAFVTAAAALAAGIAFAGMPLPTPRPAAAPAKPSAPIPLPQKRPSQAARSASSIIFAPPDSATAAASGHMLLPRTPPAALLRRAQAEPAAPPAPAAAAAPAVQPAVTAVAPITPPPSPPAARHSGAAFAMASTSSTPSSDIEGLKEVLAASRKAGRDADADAAARALRDPLARKLAEYIILRSNDTNPSFERYAAFAAANPTWPHAALFRRRAENSLWNDKVEDGAVRSYFAQQQPTTAKGRFVLARALLAQGERERAAALVRHAWRSDDFSAEVESKVMDMFGDMLTHADHKARMENRLYNDDAEAGLRAAERLGGTELLVARARAAVIRNQRTAAALLDSVPHSARHEAGYIFA